MFGEGVCWVGCGGVCGGACFAVVIGFALLIIFFQVLIILVASGPSDILTSNERDGIYDNNSIALSIMTVNFKLLMLVFLIQFVSIPLLFPYFSHHLFVCFLFVMFSGFCLFVCLFFVFVLFCFVFSCFSNAIHLVCATNVTVCMSYFVLFFFALDKILFLDK